MIPKKIFQTWKETNSDKMSDALKLSVEKNKQNNLDHEYFLFSDDDIHDFVKTNYSKEIWEAFNELNIIVAKTDFFRYLVLYHYGGIYIDIDTYCPENLEKIIDYNLDAVISRECPPLPFFVQWALIFCEKHIILEKTIEEITKNIWKRRQPIALDGRVNDIHIMTGPGIYSKIIYKILNLNFPYIVSRDTEEVFYHDDKTTKLIGIDYHNFFVGPRFLVEMYGNYHDWGQSTHWGIEQLKKPLLKSGAFFENEKFKLIKDSNYLYYIPR